jgi:hypothetical protein
MTFIITIVIYSVKCLQAAVVPPEVCSAITVVSQFLVNVTAIPITQPPRILRQEAGKVLYSAIIF